MKKVILGMPGPWAEDGYEASDHYTTKIGGVPDWPAAATIVKPDLLSCSVCKSILLLVAQIYAPISTASLMIEERSIYVFGCVSLDCGSTPESWRAFRIQRSLEKSKLDTDVSEMCDSATILLNSEEGKHDDDVGHDDDDEEDDDIDLDDLYNGFSDLANTTSVSNSNNSHQRKATTPKKTPRILETNIPVVPCFYIYTQEEEFSKKIDSVISSYNSLYLQENRDDLENNSQDEKWDEEGYEYDKALNADRTYLKFQKRVDAYPHQCFRYSFGGTPLLAKLENLDSRPCCLCGGSRHYEMQLMPPLLYFIESAINENHKFSLENWNWMTLIVFTCSNSCSKPSDDEMLINEGWFVAEEAVMLQHE